MYQRTSRTAAFRPLRALPAAASTRTCLPHQQALCGAVSPPHARPV